MQDSDALFEALRQSSDGAVVAALDAAVRQGSDADLARINALHFAAAHGLGDNKVIAAFVHAARLGLLEMSWNVLCPSCRGVLDANATLKTVRQTDYHCAFCAMASEPTLDDSVEVAFGVSPRARRIAAHDPATLPFWDYQRQIFFSSAVDFPAEEAFDDLAARCMLDTTELAAGDRMILSFTLPSASVIVFDPVTHTAHFIEVEGEPTATRQDLTVVFDSVGTNDGRSVLRPGPLRLTLDNRTASRVLAGVFVAGSTLDELIGRRRPFLTAKRLLSNQTFRDIYRTETLDIDQRLKIVSLTFLFTDLTSSTALYERVGDLVAYDLVRAHFRVLNEIVASEGGAVVKTIGDALMATFPLPHQAVGAALRMRRSMRELNKTQGGGDDLILKIGLHEGPCLAVNLNDQQDYFGQTVNIASRVQELAASDGICATEPIMRHPRSNQLLESEQVFTRSQSRSLRGIGDRMPIYELT